MVINPCLKTVCVAVCCKYADLLDYRMADIPETSALFVSQ